MTTTAMMFLAWTAAAQARDGTANLLCNPGFECGYADTQVHDCCQTTADLHAVEAASGPLAVGSCGDETCWIEIGAHGHVVASAYRGTCLAGDGVCDVDPHNEPHLYQTRLDGGFIVSCPEFVAPAAAHEGARFFSTSMHDCGTAFEANYAQTCTNHHSATHAAERTSCTRASHLRACHNAMNDPCTNGNILCLGFTECREFPAHRDTPVDLPAVAFTGLEAVQHNAGHPSDNGALALEQVVPLADDLARFRRNYPPWLARQANLTASVQIAGGFNNRDSVPTGDDDLPNNATLTLQFRDAAGQLLPHDPLLPGCFTTPTVDPLTVCSETADWVPLVLDGVPVPPSAAEVAMRIWLTGPNGWYSLDMGVDDASLRWGLLFAVRYRKGTGDARLVAGHLAPGTTEVHFAMSDTLYDGTNTAFAVGDCATGLGATGADVRVGSTRVSDGLGLQAHVKDLSTPRYLQAVERDTCRVSTVLQCDEVADLPSTPPITRCRTVR